MRNLNVNEISNIAGGAIGDVDQFTFALFPDEQMYGVQLTVIGYDEVTTVVPGLFTNTVYKEFYPIYDVKPIIKSTFSFF